MRWQIYKFFSHCNFVNVKFGKKSIVLHLQRTFSNSVKSSIAMHLWNIDSMGRKARIIVLVNEGEIDNKRHLYVYSDPYRKAGDKAQLIICCCLLPTPTQFFFFFNLCGLKYSVAYPLVNMVQYI